MPFLRDTLTELRAQAAGIINAALPGIDALLRYSNLGIIGEVVAQLVNGLYGYLDWIAKQSVPFTATDEYLEGWAALKKVTRNPATNAAGAASFPGENGTVVPAGVEINRADGVAYVSTAAATVTAGVAIVPVRAVEPGAGGNVPIGTQMNLGVGIAGVTATGSVSAEIGGGTDVELDSDLRSRMLLAYSRPPQGGSVDDYGQWARGVPGVTRVWVIPSGMGPGSVVLLFMMDYAQAAHGGFPQGSNGCAALETRGVVATGDQLALANALFYLQPVTALVFAMAPTANTVSLTIAGIAGASDVTKAAIADAFAAALRSGGRPGGITNISTIEAAIAAVALSAGFVLTSVTCTAGTVAPGSAGNITSDAGALPVPGAIAYV